MGSGLLNKGFGPSNNESGPSTKSTKKRGSGPSNNGSGPSKSFYKAQIQSKTILINKYKEDLAHQKAWLKETSTKDACRSQIESLKKSIEYEKKLLNDLKVKMKNAPKG